MCHSQWLNNVLGGKLSEGFLRSALSDFGEQKIIRVAVKPLVSGGVIKTFLARNQFKYFVFGMVV
jgi:hypothetical protein